MADQSCQIDLSEYRNLLISDEEYSEENAEQLEIAMKNCDILFNPEGKMSRKMVVDFINENQNDRIYLYCFIAHTCTIVEDLTKEHIQAVCHLYKHFNDLEYALIANEIKESFFYPIDVVKSGQIHNIWSKLIDTYLFFVKIGRFQPDYDTIKQLPGFNDYVNKVYENMYKTEDKDKVLPDVSISQVPEGKLGITIDIETTELEPIIEEQQGNSNNCDVI